MVTPLTAVVGCALLGVVIGLGAMVADAYPPGGPTYLIPATAITTDGLIVPQKGTACWIGDCGC